MSQATVDMNCTDYKEALTAEPGYNDESGHLASCANCQAYREEILSLNEKLIEAMEMPVPELVMPELPDIETENVVSLSSRRETPKAVWFAMAASVWMRRESGLLVSKSCATGFCGSTPRGQLV